MSVLAWIGNTPLVELRNWDGHAGVRILAKLEGSNPAGSVKDRAASYMIKEAERTGELTPDKIILEPTSGNTGIGLAMVGASKGYRVKLVLPGCVSTERRATLEAFGAELEITDPLAGTDGAIRRAHEILESAPDTYYMPNQFENPANPLAHYETTGPEIFRQSNGEIDVFVAGMGTTGTLMGVSRFLREKKPGAKTIGVEPTLGHKIQGLKNMSEAIVPKIYDQRLLDGKITVGDEEAHQGARWLAVKEGLLVGMSSGAAYVGARRIAKEMHSTTIVVLFPDRGDRYLSTNLFRSTCAKCPP
jgi:cysteine synthase B